MSFVVWSDVVAKRDLCPCCKSIPFVFAVGVTVMTQGEFATLRAVAGSLIRNCWQAALELTQQAFCSVSSVRRFLRVFWIIVSLPVCDWTYGRTSRIVQWLQHLASWNSSVLLPSEAAATIFATSPGRFPGSSSFISSHCAITISGTTARGAWSWPFTTLWNVG